MLNRILEHIKKNEIWKDECYYLNYEDDLTAVLKWYYFEKLGWCGCGCPEAVMEVIANYLEARSLPYPESDKKMKTYFAPDGDENPLVMCLAYTLDDKGFTEHGSSIFSCWLTDDGKYFLWAIREAQKRDSLEF